MTPRPASAKELHARQTLAGEHGGSGSGEFLVRVQRGLIKGAGR